MKKIILAVLLVCCSLPFSGVASAKEYPWKLKKDTDGIQVSVRKVEGSPTLEYKGLIVVDTPLEQVVRLFEEREDGRMPEWFHNCKKVKLIQENSPEDKIFYFVISMPRPVHDRDLVYRRLRITDPVAGTVEYRVRELPDIVPPQPHKVRMRASQGHWLLRRLGKDSTEVYYQQHSELGGSVPAWLVNVMAVNIPFQSLSGLRRLLLEEKRKADLEITPVIKEL